MFDKTKVKVTPVKAVTHTNYSDLIGIRGHKNFYVNLLSGKITYKEGKLKLSTGAATIMAAKMVVKEYHEQQESGQSIETVRRNLAGVKNPKVDDIYAEAIAIKQVGKEVSTIENYWKSWNHGLAFFWSGKTVSDCNDSNIEMFKKEYLKTHPTRLFGHTGVHLGVMFRHMLKHGIFNKMPDMSPLRDLEEIIKKNKQWIKPGRVYTPEEIEALKFQALQIALGRHFGSTRRQKELLSNRAHLGINLGLSGLRMKEALALKWEKLDFRRKIMHVWSFKNSKWREVPMSKEIIMALKRQKQFSGDSIYVFPMPSDPERFISNQVFEKMWFMVKRNAKISYWNVENRARFHDLRHTFATMTAELGWPPKVACDVLDMSLKEYDETYAKPGGAKKSEWMNKTWE